MSSLKRLLDRARQAAEERLPADVVDAGRKLRDRVLERTPAGVREAVAEYVGVDATPSAHAGDSASTEQPPSEIEPEPVVRGGLPIEKIQVVVHATSDEEELVAPIRAIMLRTGVPYREMDLRKHPRIAAQIAKISGVMVPPYVFINGRYWGAQYEIESLEASGDLMNVLHNRLDQISDGAKRIGKVHESFSDAVTVENILDRLRRGHILCVDDLDCWYEVDRDGTERVYYQGGPRPIEDLEAIAAEIVAAVEAEEVDATWQLDPDVKLE